MAIFGRKTARQRLRSAARDALAIPAFRVPPDCTATVIGGLWPAELATITPATAPLAAYLNSDLQRIAGSANDKLEAISRAGLGEPDRRAAEARVVNVARAFAVLRVESTVRQLRRETLEFDIGYRGPAGVEPIAAVSVPVAGPQPAATAPVAAPVAEPVAAEPGPPPESEGQRLRRMLQFVARQAPGLRWAVGVHDDGSPLLTTDLAHGWIPPGLDLPAGVRLLEPGRRDGRTAELLGAATRSEAYAPGDRLGRSGDSVPTVSSIAPRALPAIDDLGWVLAGATHWRDGLPRLAHTLAKAGAAGTGVADVEIDLLRVHLDTARYQLLAQYPEPDTAVLLNCMLLAATEGIATGDELSANYHLSWFRTLSSSPADVWV